MLTRHDEFDNEIDLVGSEVFDGVKIVNIKPQKTCSSSSLATVVIVPASSLQERRLPLPERAR